jgi:hypothetical protein
MLAYFFHGLTPLHNRKSIWPSVVSIRDCWGRQGQKFSAGAPLPWRADSNLRFRSMFSRRRHGDGRKTTLSDNKNQVSAGAFLAKRAKRVTATIFSKPPLTELNLHASTPES